MILQTIINLGYNLISGIINFLPTSTGFPPSVLSGAQTIGGYVGILDPLVDRNQILIVLLLVFGTEIGIFAFKTIMRFLAHIPIIGGAG